MALDKDKGWAGVSAVMNHQVHRIRGIWLGTNQLLTKVSAPCSSFLFAIIRILNADNFLEGARKISENLWEAPCSRKIQEDPAESHNRQFTFRTRRQPFNKKTNNEPNRLSPQGDELTIQSATTLRSPTQFYFKPLFVWTTHSTNTLQALLEEFMASLCWIHDPSSFTSKSFHNDLSAGTHKTYEAWIAALIPQSPQLKAQVRSASLRWCHKSGECAVVCA